VTKRAAVIIAAAALLVAVYLYRGVMSRKASSSNQRAPAVTLIDLGGNAFNLSSYKGKVLLINFWAAWCAPCRGEIPQFTALQDKYGSQGFQTVGISLDDAESTLRDFCRESKVNYPIVMGNQKIAEAFGGVLGLPTTFLIGRDGRIHAKHEGETDFRKLEQEIKDLLQSRAQK
jgi:cytochrome c biogenesis protein CcmG, thiol:disulfide interchange protein DsbE